MSIGVVPFMQGGVIYRLQRPGFGAQRQGSLPDTPGTGLFGGSTHRWVRVPSDQGSAVMQRLLLECDSQRLRQLLEPEDDALWRLGDAQVLQRVHQRWRAHRIELHRGEPLAQPASQERGVRSAAGTPAVTPSMLRSPSALTDQPPPGAAPLPAMEPALQASALVQAARLGLPLCELCRRQAA